MTETSPFCTEPSLLSLLQVAPVPPHLPSRGGTLTTANRLGQPLCLFHPTGTAAEHGGAGQPVFKQPDPLLNRLLFASFLDSSVLKCFTSATFSMYRSNFAATEPGAGLHTSPLYLFPLRSCSANITSFSLRGKERDRSVSGGWCNSCISRRKDHTSRAPRCVTPISQQDFTPVPFSTTQHQQVLSVKESIHFTPQGGVQEGCSPHTSEIEPEF